MLPGAMCLEYFMFATTQLARRDRCPSAPRNGVACRVLFDHLSNLLLQAPVLKRLRGAGILVHRTLPFDPFNKQWNRLDLRNHRKIVVVDGQIAFTGSQNLVEDTYHKGRNIREGIHYIELVVRVTGPIVRELNAAFITDWYSETEELLDERTAPKCAAHL
jgi:cardiolipin synthase